MPVNLENSAVATRWENINLHSSPKERQCQERSKYSTIALISHTSKVMLKILQARLQQWTINFQMFKLDLEKAEEPEIKLPTSVGSLKKQESSRKISTSALLTMPKLLTVWITTNWKILQEMGIPDHLTCLLRNLYGDQEATETDVEQQTGSKLGNEYIKAEYCHPTYLTSMQSTSCEMLGWMKHKLESRLPGEILITSDMQMTSPLWQKVKN